MATAIPLALDGGLRLPKVVVCAILSLWEHGNQKTDTSIYYSITLFLCANTGRSCLRHKRYLMISSSYLMRYVKNIMLSSDI